MSPGTFKKVISAYIFLASLRLHGSIPLRASRLWEIFFVVLEFVDRTSIEKLTHTCKKYRYLIMTDLKLSLPQSFHLFPPTATPTFLPLPYHRAGIDPIKHTCLIQKSGTDNTPVEKLNFLTPNDLQEPIQWGRDPWGHAFLSFRIQITCKKTEKIYRQVITVQEKVFFQKGKPSWIITCAVGPLVPKENISLLWGALYQGENCRKQIDSYLRKILSRKECGHLTWNRETQSTSEDDSQFTVRLDS